MSFQTVQNDDDNKGQKSKKALESALTAIWLGIQYVNQTFEDELDFDVSELDPIFAEPDKGAE